MEPSNKRRRLTNEEMVYPLSMAILKLQPKSTEYSCGGYTLKVSRDKTANEDVLEIFSGERRMSRFGLGAHGVSFSFTTPKGGDREEVLNRIRKFLTRMTHVVPLNDFAAEPPIFQIT